MELPVTIRIPIYETRVVGFKEVEVSITAQDLSSAFEKYWDDFIGRVPFMDRNTYLLPDVYRGRFELWVQDHILPKGLHYMPQNYDWIRPYETPVLVTDKRAVPL